MLLRFLLILLLAYLLLKLYFSARKPPRNPRRKDDAARGEDMVQDPQCRTYLPKSEAMLRGDHYFCSERCASLYLAERSS
jgi:uncharacterized protein